MSWKSKLEAGALFALLILGSFALAVISHESVHLLLSTKPMGICFGVCQVGNTLQPASAWAIHNDLSRNEWLPAIVGCIAFWISSIFGCVALARLYFAKTR